MTNTREEQQEQQQQQTQRTSRFGVSPGGNDQGMGVDASVSERLRDAGVDFDGESGNKDYPRFTNHYDGQEVIYIIMKHDAN